MSLLPLLCSVMCSACTRILVAADGRTTRCFDLAAAGYLLTGLIPI